MNTNKSSESTPFDTMIDEGQKASGKSDAQITVELGFERPNILTLIKQGKMKLPIERVPDLAAALDLDPAQLLRAFMSEHMADVIEVVDRVFQPMRLTQTEKRLVEHCRKLSRGRNTAPIVFDGTAVIALVMA